jgi:hypothetical protein
MLGQPKPIDNVNTARSNPEQPRSDPGSFTLPVKASCRGAHDSDLATAHAPGARPVSPQPAQPKAPKDRFYLRDAPGGYCSRHFEQWNRVKKTTP